MITAAAKTATPAQLCHATMPNSGRSANGTDAPSFMKILPITVQAIISTKAKKMRMMPSRSNLRADDIRRGLGADRRPRHLIDPADPYVGQSGVAEQRLDCRARPVMSDLRQHLIEHDRAHMRKGQPAQQLEITDPAHAEPQRGPQPHRRIQ